MSDYTRTLPPVPYRLRQHGGPVLAYGHSCAEHARAPLLDQLGQCFRLSGADPDGNENWRLAPRAVDAVRQLRADYDEACDEGEKLRARIAELEDLAEKLRLANAEWRPLVESREAQIDRLRAEVEALRSQLAAERVDAERYRAWRHAFREGECGIYNAICNAESESEHDAAIDTAIAARKGEGSEPPENCRQRLAAEGKAYPRSSCEACGQFAPLRPECDALLEAKRAAQAKGGAE